MRMRVSVSYKQQVQPCTRDFNDFNPIKPHIWSAQSERVRSSNLSNCNREWPVVAHSGRRHRYGGDVSDIHGSGVGEDLNPIVNLGSNIPPGRGTISTCRWCSAVSVERCPMETMVVFGSTSIRTR